jgi:hypothetical protein
MKRASKKVESTCAFQQKYQESKTRERKEEGELSAQGFQSPDLVTVLPLDRRF